MQLEWVYICIDNNRHYTYTLAVIPFLIQTCTHDHQNEVPKIPFPISDPIRTENGSTKQIGNGIKNHN